MEASDDDDDSLLDNYSNDLNGVVRKEESSGNEVVDDNIVDMENSSDNDNDDDETASLFEHSVGNNRFASTATAVLNFASNHLSRVTTAATATVATTATVSPATTATAATTTTAATSTTAATLKQPPKRLSIFAFTWNTESVLIAETLQRNGQEPVSFYSEKWLGCRQADFLPSLIQQHIFGGGDESADCTLGRHHLLVVALQESAKPGDYLQSHTFGNQLGERYILVKRCRMMGVGRTTMNALRKEGAVRARGLRLAVYARKDFLPFVHFQAEKAVLCTLQDRFTRGKGGLGIVLRVDGFGLMAFFNVHLPFAASTLTKGNHARLATGVRQQNEAFCNILEQFLHRRALHHLFVLGDLNYRVMNPANIVDAAGLCAAMSQRDEFRQRIYLQCDELRQSLLARHLPLPFVEGVGNAGPQFMPTAKMQHRRAPGSTVPGAFKFGAHNHRNPSWCDRILYLPGSLQKTPTISQLLAESLENSAATAAAANNSIAVAHGDGINTSAAAERQHDLHSGNEPAVCTYYNRFESGETMTLSDHSAVCAYYEINR